MYMQMYRLVLLSNNIHNCQHRVHILVMENLQPCHTFCEEDQKLKLQLLCTHLSPCTGQLWLFNGGNVKSIFTNIRINALSITYTKYHDPWMTFHHEHHPKSFVIWYANNIRETVDSLCRDGRDVPLSSTIIKHPLYINVPVHDPWPTELS